MDPVVQNLDVVTVEFTGLSTLNAAARAELFRNVERYGTALLSEAGRLEAAQHATGGDPEITSTMIHDADILLRRGYARRRPSLWPLLFRVVAVVAAIVAGVAGTALDSGGGQAAFVASVIAVVVTTAISYIQETRP